MVKKASGEKEPFSHEKFEDSLKRAGADDAVILTIKSKVNPLLYEGITTKKIYKKAFKLLSHQKRVMAARYSLKKAIMELGPSGYAFERLVGELFKNSGFETDTDKIIQGRCVQHEVDVVAYSSNTQNFVECKFYNNQGKRADVKVPLYIHSRFEDIINKRKIQPEYNGFSFQGWVVANTRFTSDAMDYGKCAGLNLVSWDYPKGQSLKERIEEHRLFPITTITFLNKVQKSILLDDGIVICRQIHQNPGVLDKLDLSESLKQKILNEVNDLC